MPRSFLIGSQVGMEKIIVPKEGYPIEYIRVRGFERELSLETLAAVKGIFDGISDSKKGFSKTASAGPGGWDWRLHLRSAASRGSEAGHSHHDP